jgi:hypothetical protein
MIALRDIKNCLKLLGIYETENSVNLILEFIEGGELINKILQKNKCKVNDAKLLM